MSESGFLEFFGKNLLQDHIAEWGVTLFLFYKRRGKFLSSFGNVRVLLAF
ncbi:hypothetical protein LEP1GSC049_2768 [Leptospira kirschneri serovar Cynopteri str. 3522 CT]|nr:hypothetical protein LEP1GSC049_2768 [Leptospira kirschneri serovar Cynopteri str. 3522 CT]